MPRVRGAIAVTSIVVLVAACASAGRGTPAPSAAAPSRVAVTAPPTPRASPSQSVTSAPSFQYLYDPRANARADVEAAFAAAKASGKRVLIDYGADWCPDCHSLAAFMDSQAGRALIEPAFEVVKVDVGYWDHNLDVAAEYGSAIANGIPAVVVYTADGKLVGSSADGSLANARAMTEGEVLRELAAWAK